MPFPQQILSINHWQSKSRTNYPPAIDLVINDEKYCTKTNQIVPDIQTKSLCKVFGNPHYYNPHHLLAENEDLLSPYQRHYISVFKEDRPEPRYNTGTIDRRPIYQEVECNYLKDHKQRKHYEKLKRFSRLIGDVPIENRFSVLDKHINETDKVQYTKRLTIEQLRAIHLATNEYTLKREDYNEIKFSLIPRRNTINFVSRRAISVFFSHEIRYIPKDNAHQPESHYIHPIRDYIIVENPINNHKRYGKLIRGKRTSNKGIQSILKIQTSKHEIHETWERRYKNYRDYLLVDPKFARKSLYTEISQSNGILTKKSCFYSLRNSINTRIHFYQYYINRQYYHDLIDEAENTRIVNTTASNKIKQAFRNWKQTHHTLYRP